MADWKRALAVGRGSTRRLAVVTSPNHGPHLRKGENDSTRKNTTETNIGNVEIIAMWPGGNDKN